VTKGEITPEIRQSVLLWSAVFGALEMTNTRSKLSAQVLSKIDIEPTRVYAQKNAREFLLRRLASMWTPLHRRWMASSSVPLFGP